MPSGFCKAFRGGSDSKESACSAGDPVLSLGGEDPLKKGIAAHSRILAWRIPWTEKPGGLHSMGLQRVRTRLAGRASNYLNSGVRWGATSDSSRWVAPLTQRKWQGSRIKHNHLGPTLGASRYNLTLKDRIGSF